MKKILITIALILMLGATALGYLNYRRYRAIIAEQEFTIQQQRKLSSDLEMELKTTKETLSSESADQEKNKNELLEAQKAQEKAMSDLAEAQKQLQAKEAELTQLKNDLVAKTTRVQELEAQQQAAEASKQQLEEGLAKRKKTNGKTKSTPAQLKEESVPSSNNKQGAISPGQEGKILAVNQTWNFVVINLGDQNGMLNGSEIMIKRDAKVIAKAKITSVEPLTSVADLIPNSMLPGSAVQAGDVVVCVAVEKEAAK